MTDKEKLESILPTCKDDFNDIVLSYIDMYNVDFSPTRLFKLLLLLTEACSKQTFEFEIAVAKSCTKAMYIKSYLEGKMWKDEQSARENVGAQIKNAMDIISACREANGRRGYKKGDAE